MVIEIQLLKPQVFLEEKSFLDVGDGACDAVMQFRFYFFLF